MLHHPPILTAEAAMQGANQYLAQGHFNYRGRLLDGHTPPSNGAWLNCFAFFFSLIPSHGPLYLLDPRVSCVEEVIDGDSQLFLSEVQKC